MKLSRCCVFSLFLILLVSFSVNGQEKIRKIGKKNQMRNEPIELVNSEVGNKTFDKKNQILADKDWLKNLKLELKNISGKRIVYMELSLVVEPQGKLEHPLFIPLRFGQLPFLQSSQALKNTDAAQLEVLKPNESVKVSIKPYSLDSLMPFMQEMGIEDIESVKIFFEFVVFDDGTAWSKGYKMRQNPNNERQWDVVSSSQKEASLLSNGSIVDSAFRFNSSQTSTNGCGKNNISFARLKSPSLFLRTI